MTSQGAKNEVLSDRLMALLKERVADKELITYLDELIPAYKLPDARAYALDERRLDYHVNDFLNYFDAEFIEVAYLCLFKRRVDGSGLTSSLHGLRFDKYSRVFILGRLRYSDEGRRNGVEVRGLKVRYFSARVRQIPFLGALIGSIVNLKKLPRLDTDLGSQDADGFASVRKLSSLEHTRPDPRNDAGDSLEITSDTRADVAGTATLPGQGEEHYQLSLSKLTSLPSEEYLDSIYDLVLRRKPTISERREAMNVLASGYRSKIILVGDLYASTEAYGSVNDISGLSTAYRTEKILSTPWIGPILQLPRAIRTLSRLDLIVDHQSAENLHQLSEVETRLMLHRNRILARLKSTLVEALEDEETKR
jgi:hypothetical protein